MPKRFSITQAVPHFRNLMCVVAVILCSGCTILPFMLDDQDPEDDSALAAAPSYPSDTSKAYKAK
jgi:hypothetical protein